MAQSLIEVAMPFVPQWEQFGTAERGFADG
jgi:hypothetical protein